MAKVLLLATGNAALAASNSNFAAVSGGTFVQWPTEAWRQVVSRAAGTISGLAVCKENTSGIDVLIRSRVNGSNGNQSVSPANGSAAGPYEDVSNSDSLSIGDKFDISIAENGTPNPQLYWARLLFEAASGHAALYACVNPSNISSAAATVYATLSGNGSLTGTEADRKCRIRTAGTLTGGYCYVSSNARVSTTTIRSRINASDGNVVISVGAGLTGLFEDNTHSDAIATGDDVDWSVTTGAGTQTLTAQLIGTTVVCSTVQNDLFASRGAVSRTASGTASFTNFSGDSGASVAEARFQVRHGFVGTASRLRLYVSANSYTGAATVAFRRNGSDGNQAITIGAGLTGLFEDTGNTDDFDEDDDCCVKIVGGTSGTLTYQWVGITEAPVTGTTEAGAASWSCVGILDGALSQVHSASGAWSADGLMAAGGQVGKFGAGAWSGNAAIAASGRLSAKGLALLSGGSSLSAASFATRRGGGEWAGNGSLAAGGRRVQYGAGAWGGACDWWANARLIARGRASWSATSLMIAGGGIRQVAGAAWSAAAILNARGRLASIFVGASAAQGVALGGKTASAMTNWVGKGAAPD